MKTLRWFLRAVWGDLRRHCGHEIRRYEFWETSGRPLAWCETCENVITLPRWLKEQGNVADEEYERVKREIGWHATGGDVLLAGLVLAVVLIVALA